MKPLGFDRDIPKCSVLSDTSIIHHSPVCDPPSIILGCRRLYKDPFHPHQRRSIFLTIRSMCIYTNPSSTAKHHQQLLPLLLLPPLPVSFRLQHLDAPHGFVSPYPSLAPQPTPVSMATTAWTSPTPSPIVGAVPYNNAYSLMAAKPLVPSQMAPSCPHVNISAL